VEDFTGAFELGGVDFDAAGGFFLFATDGHGVCGSKLANGHRCEGYGIFC
jgi:hypothetical protein